MSALVELKKQLREQYLEKSGEAWRRTDGGQDLCIGASLAYRGEEALDALERENAELSRDLEMVQTQLDEAESALAALRREALDVVGKLTEAKALHGVRSLVAGWNGEGREDGQHYERHPAGLGATLPTNCGAVYELDDALRAARAFHEQHSQEGE